MLRTLTLGRKLYPHSVLIVRQRYLSQFVEVRHEKHDKYCVASVILNRPPVNSFDVAYTEELTRALKEIEKAEVDGLILKSKNPSIFSSGLDLHDLYAQPRSHLELFWRRVQDLWLQLYSLRLPTIAAINGHCLAGGTILAAACDYRLALEGNYGIGVTAAKIGLIAPPWFLKMLTYVMGQRNTEWALQLGHVFTPREAMGVGLVDKVCSKDMMDEECWKALEPFLTVSAESRATMKLSLRSNLIDDFLGSREEDMNNMIDFILKDSVQSNLGKYMEQLKSKAKN